MVEAGIVVIETFGVCVVNAELVLSVVMKSAFTVLSSMKVKSLMRAVRLSDP
jgi:hypothetical protein